MTTKLETLLTPIGDITFLAVNKPVQKYDKSGYEYLARLEFDLSKPEVKSFRETVEKLNAKKVVVSKADAIVGNTLNEKVPAGKMQMSFKTAFTREDGQLAPPTVLNQDGQKLIGMDVPNFHTSYDTGKAQVEAAISTSGKQPTLYLRQIALVELTQGERPEQEAMESELQIALKRTHEKATLKSK